MYAHNNFRSNNTLRKEEYEGYPQEYRIKADGGLPFIDKTMNISKFTQNSIQSVENCEKLAYEYGHQEITVEHLLYSLLQLEDSLIKKLLEKMDINAEVFLAQVKGQAQIDKAATLAKNIDGVKQVSNKLEIKK